MLSTLFASIGMNGGRIGSVNRPSGARVLASNKHLSTACEKDRRMIRFGPAGFLYKDWAGIVYPEPKPKGFDPLAYIAAFFEAVEINSSYYCPPASKTAASWSRRVADNPDFRFTAKMWQRFTHHRKNAWTRDEVGEVRAGFDVLMNEDRLGAVLLQFPWSFRRTDENSAW